ncbi:MAG: glycosylase, partial [Clostridia bacterium]|nr:glycosylase [Clostridia bacterium]
LVNYFSSQPALNYGFYEVTHPAWQLPVNHPDCLRTAEAIKDVMRFWLDMGCDGFRVDMADSLVKNDDEKIATAAIWAGVREMMDKDYPDCALVSEWCHPIRAINKAGFHADFYLDHRGNGYSTAFRYYNYDTGKQESFFSKEGNGDIMTLVNEFVPNYEATKDNGYISFFTCNHDNPRMSAWYDDLELKINFCTIFTLPGVPFLYYGDEIGMRYMSELTSKEGGFSRTGSRTPMQWSKGKNKGFSDADPDKLYLPVDTKENAPDVESQMADENSLYNTVKKIIAIRKANAELCGNGDFEVLYAEKNKYPFIFKRGSFVAAVNPKAEDVSVPFEYTVKEYVFTIGDTTVKDGSIAMSGQSYALMKI